jgi:hypothetical protein
MVTSSLNRATHSKDYVEQTMDDLDDIKTRVGQLRPEQQAQLRSWFLERDQLAWDAEIARDLAEGKLDDVIAEAKSDRDAGRARDL